MIPAPLPGPLTRDEAIAIVRAACSPEDLRKLRATPDGEAMFLAFIDPFVELSRKLDRSITARHIIARKSDVYPPAASATRATASVAIKRSKVGTAITLPSRSRACRVITEEGHRYELQLATTFEAGHAGPKSVTVEAVVAGYASTVIAQRIVAFEKTAHGASADKATVTIVSGLTYLSRTVAGDRFFEEMVGLYVEFTAGSNFGKLARIAAVIDPAEGTVAQVVGDGLVAEIATATWIAREWAELGFTVAQSADSTQGTDDELHGLARERGLEPQADATDDALRGAIMSLADTVSPAALVRLANRTLGDYGPVMFYEGATSAVELDYDEGDRPFPGVIWGLTPLGIAPDAIDAPIEEDRAPPAGLACLVTSPGYFLLRWDGAGLGDPGASWKGAVGFEESDTDPPMGAAWGVSPLGGYAIGDEAIRATIAAGIDKIRGGGVRWTFYPRRW